MATKKSIAPPGRAAIYARISRDPEGTQFGVERQIDDCRNLATRLGVDVVSVFVDNDVSASTKSKKARPQFDAMIELVRAGKVGTVLAYSNSRLTRRPMEWEVLIQLHQSHGVVFRTIASGTADLSTADGRAIARTIAAWDAAESERISERGISASKQRAKRGEWDGGWAPCGYVFERDAANRIVGFELDPDRAPVIQEMAKRVIEGESLYSLCRVLNERATKGRGPWTSPGAKSPTGSEWRARTLKRVLTNPAVTGLRAYNGELHEGAWPRVLDREMWTEVCEVLSESEATNSTGDSSRRRAISGLVRCGAVRTEPTKTADVGDVCGGNMFGQDDSIACMRSRGGCGHNRVNYEALETWVTRMLVERLDSPELRDARRAADADTSKRRAELRSAIAQDERRLRRAQDDRADDLLSRDDFRRQQNRLTQRITANREALGALRTAVGTHVDSGDDLVGELNAATVERQRAILGTFVERVVIGPGARASVLEQRKDETGGEFDARRRDNVEAMLKERVRVSWRA